MAKKKKTLVLIDGHAHLFQSFHAIQELTDPQGQPVNAIYGFLNMLFRILEKFDCTHLAVVFDSPGPTFRHEIYPEYKANRGEMDESLSVQIPRLQELLTKMKFPTLAKAGFECDDLVGTLATQAAKKNYHVILISDDKDFAQLLGKKVHQYKNRKDQLVDPETLKEELGIEPKQMIDYLALMGDSSDNVPGVPGIGPKTATNLLQTYGTAKNLYKHLDDLKGKQRENLENNQELFELSKELVTIDLNVPIEVDLDALVRQPWDDNEVADAFRDFGFKRFLTRLNLNDHSAKEETSQSSVKRNYQCISTINDLKKLIKELKKYQTLAIDTETMGLNPYRDKIVGLSLAWSPGEAAYVVFDSPDGGIDLEKARDLLNPFLQDPKITWVGHNLKFDATVLKQAGLTLSNQWEDTLLLAFTLNSSNRRLKLDDLVWDLLEEKMIPIENLIGKGKKAITMEQVPLETVTTYAAEDADMTLRLHQELLKDVPNDDRRLEKYRQQEIPLSQILAQMEQHGVRLDTKALKKLSDKAQKELAKLEKKIYQSAGHEFNINSPKQLGEVLFEELGLPVIRKTKTGFSTDSKVLAKLAPLHEIPSLIEENRQLAKLKNTYMDSLPELVDGEGILHTTFSQTAAITGRVSSNHPNLQNIPIRNPRGRAIREAFFPRQHESFLSADYSQIELRLMAHYSQDPELCRAFSEDLDIHRFVAAQINGIEPDEVSDDQRTAAKAVNFGTLYGQGAYGLSELLGISQHEAKEFIEEYFKKFKTIQDFITSTIEKAKADGFVETLGGHRRPILEFKSPNAAVRKMAERISVNTLMQGSAADLIKTAMLKIQDWLDASQPETSMVLQIHDELVFDVSPKDISSLTQALHLLMTEVMELSVPLKINVHSGPNWLEVK